MKKDGFTLIELLAVIAIMAVLSLVVGLNINKMMKNQKDDDIATYKETLEKAACVYAENNYFDENQKVYFSDLVKAGLISKDLENPETKENELNRNTHYIEVTFVNNEKKCTYK